MTRIRAGFRASGIGIGCAVVALAGAPTLRGQSPEPAAPPAFYKKYLVSGNPLDDEILSMETRVAANPSDATLRNDFGNLLALRHFPEQAAEQYEMAAKLDKSNFIAYYNLGILRETEGKIGNAISAYKKSIGRKPGFPPSRFRLGRLYEHTGSIDAAVEQYARALRIDPEMRDPRRNPLVIDSRLMYQVSLFNYERDVARVTLNRDVTFVEEPAFRRVPVDRAVGSEEVAPVEEQEPPPREVSSAGPASSPPATGPGTVGGPSRRPPRSNAPAAPGADSPPRQRTGTRPGGSRTTHPPPPSSPTGTGVRSATPETAPNATSQEPSMNDPGAPETAAEPAPTPAAPEEIEPS